jgi:hypothetical protein
VSVDQERVGLGARLSALPPVAGPQSWLEYSLIMVRPRRGGRAVDVEGILVEEFDRGHDWSAVGLSGAVWRSRQWRSAASFSRTLRADPDVLDLVVPTDRQGAAAVHRSAGHGRLPNEATLRSLFLDYEPLSSAPPLRLGPADVPGGFREKRLYRILLAKEPRSPLGDGRRTLHDDRFSWTARRVGNGLAWALDVTVLLAGPGHASIGPVLRELTDAARLRGLVHVTTERFS